MKTLKSAAMILAITLIAGYAFGKTTYNCNGANASKGEAVKLLVTGKAASCIETRVVVFNDKTGTLKGAK